MLTRRRIILFASGLAGAVLVVAVGWTICLRRGLGDVRGFYAVLETATTLDVDGMFAPSDHVTLRLDTDALDAVRDILELAEPELDLGSSFDLTLGAALATNEYVVFTAGGPDGTAALTCVAGRLTIPNRCTVIDLTGFQASDVHDELVRLGLVE